MPAAWFIFFLVACAPDPAVPLPPPVRAAVALDARRVATPTVRGYLARPLRPAREQLPAVLMLADALDEADQALARAAATPEGDSPGAVVLLIPPETSEASARAYLEGMSGVAPPATLRCLRVASPCVSPSP